MTIGAYDGVHLGHRALLAELRARAADERPGHRGGHLRPPPGLRGAPRVGPAAAVRPRPEARAAGVGRRRPDGGGPLRRGAGQRDGRGVRRPGSWSRASDARLVVVGEDFHFGHGRKGNVALLTEMGAVGRLRGGRGVAAVRRRDGGPGPARLVHPDPRRWWPTAGRGGRRPAGPAPPGAGPGGHRRPAGRGRARLPDGQRGRARPRSACPAAGHLRRLVRAARRRRAGRRPSRWAGARPSTAPTASCWSRPTCSTSPATSTARPARLSFVHRLRDELAFDSVDALVAQMGRRRGPDPHAARRPA